MQADITKMIETIGIDRAEEILGILGITNLHDVNSRDYISDGCEWRCGVEGKWWPIEARQMTLSDEYAVRWTTTDEAGIEDVEIVERAETQEEDEAELAEWVREIALGCGSCDGTVR